jgi:hypothetical protein
MINGCSIIAAIPRFERKLRKAGECRVWQGAQTRGGKCKGRGRGGGPYGKFWIGPAQTDTIQAHVFAAFLDGKIPTLRVPEGMHLDHDLDNCPHGSLCVACTELVTAEVNLARRHSRRIAPQPR